MSVEAERMRTALDLHDLGVKIYRQRLRRQFPESSDDDIERRVRDWLTAPTPPDRIRASVGRA